MLESSRVFGFRLVANCICSCLCFVFIFVIVVVVVVVLRLLLLLLFFAYLHFGAYLSFNFSTLCLKFMSTRAANAVPNQPVTRNHPTALVGGVNKCLKMNFSIFIQRYPHKITIAKRHGNDSACSGQIQVRVSGLWPSLTNIHIYIYIYIYLYNRLSRSRASKGHCYIALSY